MQPASSSLPPNLEPSPEENSRGSRSHAWIWLVVLAAAIGGAVFYFRTSAANSASNASGQQTMPSGPPSVGVIAVEKRDIPYYLTGLGNVTAFNSVTVKSRVDGELLHVYFREGQFVKQADKLAEIDPRPYQAALDQAEGALARDQAQLVDAKLDLGRYTQLVKEAVVAQQQLDAQKATVGQLEGAIQADKAQIETQKLNLAYSEITAPIGGRVGLRLVDAGNIVHATDPGGLVVITQVQPIAVIFTLPEDDLPLVTAEMKNRELGVEAYDRDDKKKLADGKLMTVDNQIDPTTGTVKLKAEFDNRDLSLWPNQFVNTRLFLSVKRNAIVIPSAAVERGNQGSFVYLIDSGTAQVRTINVDFVEGSVAVIGEGLKPGEEVVVDGQDKLQSGVKVETHEAAPAQTGRGSTAETLTQ